ncbi:aminotransferase class I/II-fold pyridoxal phosphate-dependent enzyme [Streptomyces parvus]|uniref:Aminotransferase class I/II-fold pyridoxal phosphate-dependent enzyme n=1 Tax=Streptomyces parvus TaxID=66428 RepID=A0A5D4JIS1_9ACTN|nr:aminotransferase class I/II-fold pyridoxal phosphate-dependent enzyme [Streptomyces parvus]TYR65182.1 aminotransferase class I/II-fold pyridoxal phosphate-dependent enzyme [Streptomyces parvus]
MPGLRRTVCVPGGCGEPGRAVRRVRLLAPSGGAAGGRPVSTARQASGNPWYLDFFGEDFWAVAAHEYTPERTATEVHYLAAVLEASAPGRRVLDLGCGTGRHALALARRGFQVTGVDASAWALRQAQSAAAATGVPVRWLRRDLLHERPWQVDEFDAIICVQSFGWGTDPQQLRLLREARRALVPGGLLLLDHSNVLAIAGHYVPEATFEAEGLRAEFRRNYQVASGRSTGSIEVRRGGAEPAVIHDDVRMYQPAEVRDLLTRAGFTVERVDADFVVEREAGTSSRYVQFLARNRETRTDAISSWGRPPEDRSWAVDLRWSPDEVEFLRPAIDAAFRSVYAAGDVAELARDYHVTDPYAGDRAAPVLSKHFGFDMGADMVTAGAGATGLLHACAVLAAPGPVLSLARGYPDLPHVAARMGCETVVTRLDRLAYDLDRHAPSMLVVDRPTFEGDLYSRARLDEIVEAARLRGTTVVLDEAYATYLGPGASCVPAVAEHDNLIVIRSMSKGYCCGGLRVGFAVAAPELTRRLRESAPPLGANSAGLAVALHLLGQGDIFAGLRARIAEIRPTVSSELERVGLQLTEGDHRLPWVTVRDARTARSVLAELGVRTKQSGGGAGYGFGEELLKVAVPLSKARLAAFRATFAHAD